MIKNTLLKSMADTYKEAAAVGADKILMLQRAIQVYKDMIKLAKENGENDDAGVADIQDQIDVVTAKINELSHAGSTAVA